MKRCPKCSRTYPDENQKFCTIDGGLLMAEQPNFDPNLTVRATSKELAQQPPVSSEFSEAPTSMRLPSMDETITAVGTSTFSETATAANARSDAPTSSDLASPAQSAPTSADLRQASQSAPTSADLRPPVRVAPTSTELTPPAATTVLVSQPVSADLPASQPQSQATPPPVEPVAPAKKKSMLPMVIGIVVILLILIGGGAAAAGYFLWLKPRMEADRRPAVTVGENENTNTNTNANTSANTNSESANANSSANANTAEVPKKESEPFVPTSGAVQFGNSKANLDGKLLEHYVDFSFYYPQTWQKDPNAGVAGASNFARLSDSSEQYAGEQVAFGWYTSNGTFELDNAVFRDRVKALSDNFAKSLPNYQELSQGITSVNTMSAYEFRFKGVFKGTPKGDLPYWGRVIFLPPGDASEKNGVTIIMLATSLASEVSGPDDVGAKGKLPLILESFRFSASR